MLLSSSADNLGYYFDGNSGARASLPWPGDPALPYSHPSRVALLPPSLGLQVIRWAESNLIHALTGLPWRFTQGQRRFLMLWYAVDVVTGRWVFRRAAKRGSKGTGKDHFMAALMLCELLGPVRIARVVDGRPVGEPHRMPLVQVAANSEAQGKKVMRIANAMISNDLLAEHGVDKGQTQTKLDAGGLMECLTSSEESAEGDPPTAAFLNETHHMKRANGGHRMAGVVRRNVGKSPRDQQARIVDFTNAHVEGSDAIAERTFKAWKDQQSGRGKFKRDILYDSVEAWPGFDVYDEAECRAALAAAYSDCPWADLDRLYDEVLDPELTLSDALRFYFNVVAANEESWVEPRKFDALGDSSIRVDDRESVALFLDCSKSQDSTALIGCRLSDWHVFTLGVWQRPPSDVRGDQVWRAPRGEVDAAVRDAMARLRVWWFGVDPSPATDDTDEASYWMPLLDEWHRDFRSRLIWATPGVKGHAVRFDMRLSQPGGGERNQAFVSMAEQTAEIIDSDDPGTVKFTHDNDPTLVLHVHHARRHPTRWGVSLGKENRDSSRLVDAAVTMVGARLGARIVRNSGKWQPLGKQTKARAVVFR